MQAGRALAQRESEGRMRSGSVVLLTRRSHTVAALLVLSAVCPASGYLAGALLTRTVTLHCPYSVCIAGPSPRRGRSRGSAVVVCQEDERGSSPGQVSAETRRMDWDDEDEAVRGASKMVAEKKSQRIGQLRAELQEAVRREAYTEAAILQEQIQALERNAVRAAFDEAPARDTTPALSSELVLEDLSVLSASRGPMQRRPVRTLAKEPARVLSERERSRENEEPDNLFYAQARLVTHVDLQFGLRLQELYQKRLLPGSAVLDLGSACVSYMPEGVALRSVVGLGMNLDEMKANDDLTERVVHDLNANPSLPFDDNAFDAVVCASALQYLTQPELVLQMLCV